MLKQSISNTMKKKPTSFNGKQTISNYTYTLVFMLAVTMLLYACFTYFSCKQATYKDFHYGLKNFFIPDIPSSKLFGREGYDAANVTFNISSSRDVIVFLHIQKTGGTTFGRHLVNEIKTKNGEALCICDTYNNLQTNLFSTSITDKSHATNGRKAKKRKKRRKKKKKRCACTRPNSETIWLFSRYSTGWKCGLHADWTELHSCVDSWFHHKEDDISNSSRRYFYITILREPVARYISEFRHVQRGATWKGATLVCNDRSPTAEEVRPCFSTATWEGVSLDEFLECDHNLANDRITRMLADLRLVNCYNQTNVARAKRNSVMLASAKANLQNMLYFALAEYQKPSQYMFEKTFNLEFNEDFEEYFVSKSKETPISEEQRPKILERTSLDGELYDFARKLFLARYQYFQELYPEDFDNDTDTERLLFNPRL